MTYHRERFLRAASLGVGFPHSFDLQSSPGILTQQLKSFSHVLTKAEINKLSFIVLEWLIDGIHVSPPLVLSYLIFFSQMIFHRLDHHGGLEHQRLQYMQD